MRCRHQPFQVDAPAPTLRLYTQPQTLLQPPLGWGQHLTRLEILLRMKRLGLFFPLHGISTNCPKNPSRTFVLRRPWISCRSGLRCLRWFWRRRSLRNLLRPRTKLLPRWARPWMSSRHRGSRWLVPLWRHRRAAAPGKKAVSVLENAQEA